MDEVIVSSEGARLNADRCANLRDWLSGGLQVDDEDNPHPSPHGDVTVLHARRQAPSAVDTARMDEVRLGADLLTSALEHLRLMSRAANLGQGEGRRELYAIVDLVHNLPGWLVDPCGLCLTEHLTIHANPLAAPWIIEGGPASCPN